MIKQRTIAGLGPLVDSMFSCLPFLSIINFGFVAVILYTDMNPWLKIWAPWVEIWMFLLFLFLLTCGMMFVVYKFVLPSLWTFRGKQLFGFESEVLDTLRDIKARMDKIDGAETNDETDSPVAGT